jgi:uncharacterized membrane protein YfcA
MIHLEPWQWALAFTAAALVGVSKTGISGLGMLFVAIFAQIIPSTKQATGIVLPLLIFGDLVAAVSYRRHAVWSHVVRLFPWAAVGVVIGFFALGSVNDHVARRLIGVIICSMVTLHVWRRWRKKPGEEENADHGPWYAAMIGILIGFTTLVANAAGPLSAIYLLAMRLPKMEYVGTGAIFFMLLNWFKVPFMAYLGLITFDSFKFNLVLAPAVLLGAVIGRWLLPKIDQKLFEFLALLLSSVAGVKMLF